MLKQQERSKCHVSLSISYISMYVHLLDGKCEYVYLEKNVGAYSNRIVLLCVPSYVILHLYCNRINNLIIRTDKI